jgi:Interferon-induced transmembrane protein
LNCPYCSTSNLDNASLCINCGKPLNAAPPPPQVSQSYTPPPPSQPSYAPPSYGSPSPAAAPPPGGANPVIYLILSILMVLCCCNPVAIVPLVFSIMAMSRRSAGDYAGAQVNASRAALWFWIALVALIIWNVIFFMFMGGMATIEEIRRNFPQ